MHFLNGKNPFKLRECSCVEKWVIWGQKIEKWGGLSNLELIDKFLTKRKRDNVKNMSHVGADHVGSNLHNLYGT